MLNPKSQRAKTLHSTADIFFEGQVIGSEKKMRITKGNSEWPACPISWLHRIRCFEDCKQEACHMLPEPKKSPSSCWVTENQKK